MPHPPTSAAETSSVDWDAVASDIRGMLPRRGYDNGNIGPLLARLAWHAAGTFDKTTNTGGSNGATMRFEPEADDNANAGLHIAREFLELLKKKYPAASYADIWTLAGAVSIEALGGPQIVWKPGRIDYELKHSFEHPHADVSDPSKCPFLNATAPNAIVPPNGRLPDAALDAAHLRAVFYRMGFTDRDIVALSGAHALGMCHTDRSGYDGVWTHTPNEFNNRFFVLLLELTWVVRDWDDWEGPLQYMDRETEQLMMLPTDMALLWDPQFRVYVEMYAKDQALFFKDFADAFERLLELGVVRNGPQKLKGVSVASQIENTEPKRSRFTIFHYAKHPSTRKKHAFKESLVALKASIMARFTKIS